MVLYGGPDMAIEHAIHSTHTFMYACYLIRYYFNAESNLDFGCYFAISLNAYPFCSEWVFVNPFSRNIFTNLNVYGFSGLYHTRTLAQQIQKDIKKTKLTTEHLS